MTLEKKVFDAVVALLALGENINAYRIAQHSGIDRNNLAYYVRKYKKQNQK